MTVENQDLTYTRGTRFRVRSKIKDGNGDPLDLTNGKAWWGIWKNNGKPYTEAYLTKSTEASPLATITFITIEGVGGELDGAEWYIEEGDDPPVGTFYHELKGEDSSGNPSVFLRGEIDISPSPMEDI